MLFTVAHELTHFIKDWSSVKYRALADALVKQYQKQGVSVSELVDNQIAKAKQNGREMSRPEAFDEMVADSMESMLTDENAAAFLERLAQRDKGLKEKIVSWLKELAAKLKNALSAYKDVKPDSPEGKMVAEMEDFRKEIMGIYTSALVDAGENFRENGGTLTSDGDYLYSERVTDKDTLDFLNSQETVTTYKTMQIVDGKLYPPVASRIGGKHEDYSVLGEWEQATEHPELIKENGKFKLDKGKGQGSIEAAYNPYMHSSNLVINDQFSGAYARDNLVTVECEVPVSELTSGYRAQYAKDSVGWHAWHTGTVAGAIRKATGVERQVLLSRWIKPVRILSDSEVAAMYKDLLDGTDISVPDNVVTPSLLSELKKAGVKINESGRVKHSYREGGEKYSDRYISSDIDTNVLSLVERVKSGHYSDNEKVFFNTVSDKIASTIEKITGIDVKGFRVAIEARQIYHILNDHGPKGTSDHSMADPNDIARIRYTLDDPDDIRESGTTKAYTHFKNGKNRLAPTVLYEKSIGDKSYYVVQAVPDTKAKILYIVSAFIGKSGYKKEVQQLINANGSDATAKTGSAETSNYSIRDPNSVVKQKFSDRDPTAEATRAALEKENGKLREDVSRLRELLRLQGKVTGGTVMKPSSVEAAARWLNKYAWAKADVKELSRMLTEFYRFLATDKDYAWEDVHQRAMVIAEYLQDNVQIKPQMSDYARDVLRDIRGIKITLDESQRADVEYQYGSYEAFRKAAFGNVTFVKEGGIPLDSQWKEWASLYPGTFDSEITANDQPLSTRAVA